MNIQSSFASMIGKFRWFLTTLVLTAFVSSSTLAIAEDRDYIRIVGSSTVFPFAKAVAEEFAKSSKKYTIPVVESTGSGGGHQLFGAGLGPDTADITNSSRRITEKEFEQARTNGVSRIVEAVIGYDGISIAQSIDNQSISLSPLEITLAVAAEVPDPKGSGKLVKNPYQYWHEIHERLPHRRIKIYGPPSTSGTRDAFQELVLEKTSTKIKAYNGKYTKIRRDGHWVDSGENDDLIVKKLTNDVEAFGVFGFSFLEKNLDKVQGVKVNNVEVKFETIASGKYPLSRQLYFYFKHDHLKQVPGMMEYVNLFMDEKMIGENGHLRKLGLVPLPARLREASRHRVAKLDPLQMRGTQLGTLYQYALKNGFVKQLADSIQE